MVYKNNHLISMGQVFNMALSLAKTDYDEAQNFFKEYIKYIYEDNKNISLEKAEEIAKRNLGYFAGYFDSDICNIIYKTYECSHPIFGDNPFGVN